MSTGDLRTGFQERAPYDETIDLRTDFVMVYGMDDSTADRIARWREAGYRVHLMTGISWGTYQDYLDGRWDGIDHWDDAQTESDGTPIQHGNSTDMPYMVPTIPFTDYLVEKLRPVIALGVEGVHLEEPEFWARAGYGPALEREWRAYFGEPWQPPHSSPDAHFRSCVLKQHLLTRSLDRVTTVLRDEALRQGRDVRFYVPTHSLLNYTQWQIVSPESRMRGLVAVHGAIAQVWTGTSRTPNVYAGIHAERTFETAYLEYGIAQDLVRGTDRRLWFLHDPIEDHPDRTWEDYLANHHRTLVASLLHPGVSDYEVTPWPNRIFNRPYLKEGSSERVPIPAEQATSYLITMQTLRTMDQPVESPDGPSIGVLLSDTAMFQRWRPGEAEGHYDGLQNALDVAGRDRLLFSDFYGLALPPLMDGQRVRPVQLEVLADTPSALDDLDVLVLSYEFQKPPNPAIHYNLAGWVARGGRLLYVGDGSDPYHAVRSWWSSTPVEHLASALGVEPEAGETIEVGRGAVRFVDAAPASFTESAEKAAELVALLRELTEFGGLTWQTRDWLSIRRGPYLIGAVLGSARNAVGIEGDYLDLLSPDLSLVRSRSVQPGGMVWLLDLSYDSDNPRVLASAGRCRDWSVDSGSRRIRFTTEAPRGVEVVTALRVPGEPASVHVDGTATEARYDASSQVAWIRHPGAPRGTDVEIVLI